jgi:D-alanyl-D-alanine carboxypeptidase
VTVIPRNAEKDLYLERISAVHDALGIGCEFRETCPMPVQMEPDELVSIGLDIYEREQRMHPQAAQAWRLMKAAAESDRVVLQTVSAYRSIDHQAGIVRRKLDRGMDIEEILTVSAAPGYSEHHTGRALDIATPGFPVLEEPFEDSPAFAWLTEHAGRFGFRMSFPRGNPFGVIYEPWHWAWQEPVQGEPPVS